MLIQQNVNGSDAFNRSWAEFKVGFNDTRGNCWLGNDLLSQLTQNGVYKLRFDLQERNGSWYWAEYGSFAVLSEAHNYKMLISWHSGNASDAFYYHDEMMFTTYDRDNDLWSNSSLNHNCALLNGGGFWYKDCTWASVNTLRGRGFRWYTPWDFDPWSQPTFNLQSTRMWLMC